MTLTGPWLAERVARLTGLVEAMPETVECPQKQIPIWDVLADFSDTCICGGGNETGHLPVPNESRDRALALLTRECQMHLWFSYWTEPCAECGIAADTGIVTRNLWADLSLASWPEPVREALVLAWLREVVACFGWNLQVLGNIADVWALSGGELIASIKAGSDVEAAFQATEQAIGGVSE